MKVNLYLNMPSFYQEDFIKRLSSICVVKTYYEDDLSEDRKKLGWSSELKDYEYFFEKSLKLREILFLENEAYHVISGFPGGIKNFTRYLLAKDKKKILFQSEFPANFRKLSLFHIGALIFSKFVRKNGNIVLGIASKIRDYWKHLGIDEHQIIGWGYFVDKINDNKKQCSQENIDYNYKPKNEKPILYAGQLVYRKGVDVLLRAYSLVKENLKNEIVILGSGNYERSLRLLTKELKIDNRVSFLGSKSPVTVQQFLQNSAVLILPSRYDGWGVIVNEAMLHDVPVIVSSSVGASEIVKKFKFGEIFENENVYDLSTKLIELLNNVDKYNSYIKSCQEYKKKISTEHASKYLKYILNCIENNEQIKLKSVWDFNSIENDR